MMRLDEFWLRERLGEVYTPVGVDVWLQAPNALLGRAAPIDLIEAGRAAEVRDVVEGMIQGVAS